MEQEFHPVVFALIAYGIAAVISVCVTFIVKTIAFLVRDKKPAAAEKPKPEN